MNLFTENSTSHVPAVRTLQRLGYRYLSPTAAMRLRGGRTKGVILNEVLADQLRRINSISYKGETYEFSEANIHNAIQALREVMYEGLAQTNSRIYDLLCLGKSFKQVIGGDAKSFSLRYVDWETPSNNVYHVTVEFPVDRACGESTRRPDIVLFVNGIPFAVIECKRPDIEDPVGQAIKQHLRNQREDEIPGLYVYAQILLSLSKNSARYGATGTPFKFWSAWKEKETSAEDLEETLRDLINSPLHDDERRALYEPPFDVLREHIERWESEPRQPTAQDAALYCLCRPERLLELTYNFSLFDAGVRKIARYQQYFCVHSILRRIATFTADGLRAGGVVWHTQGSGKSLTMVMLARLIALTLGLDDYRIILVTDRVDLDDQLYDTFRNCGLELEQASTGRHLAELLQSGRKRIVATVLNKFENAVASKDLRLDDPNVFVLVDEAHRTQYGALGALMRKALPSACLIGFTGTPVTRRERNTLGKFGGLIDVYNIRDAVNDMAVVPLLYEGRHVNLRVNEKPIDEWFEHVTADLSDEQKADLKRKFSNANHLTRAEQFIVRVAWDVSVHFQQNWQGTGFKGQLVTPSKATALRYKKHLDALGMVTSEVLISAPSLDEGDDDSGSEDKQMVQAFWDRMMSRYRSEEEYNKQLIQSFKHGDEPEIIIVVDKLLTGFDAPRNTVLYLARQLREHTLLQAIARVNRLADGKEYGYIVDYFGVLAELDKALGIFADYDPNDLQGTVTNVDIEAAKLQQRHAELWDFFKTLPNKYDEEAYERHLEEEAERRRFYEALSAYARSLGLAMATVAFHETVDEKTRTRYVSDLKFFSRLRTSVRRRYAEVVDYGEYEARIQKIIDTHVGSGEVERLTDMVNIFDKEKFADEVARVTGDAARADTIAHRTMRTISEKMDEDPAFYRRFSDLLNEAIAAFREGRIKEREYLAKVQDIMDAVRNRTGDRIPDSLRDHDVAKAYYGVILDLLKKNLNGKGAALASFSAEAALRVDEIILAHSIINWTSNEDVKNAMLRDMDDYFFDRGEAIGLELSPDLVDAILDACMGIAVLRRAR